MEFVFPKNVLDIFSKLKEAGFKVYIVGGPVRDMFLGKATKDWDLATSATPDQIQKLFPESVYENQFGTVGVKTATLKGEPRQDGRESENLKTEIVEVTTFRSEGKYTDKRHPDEVKFAKTVEEDLKRRDFTMNAMALDVDSKEIVDPYDGRSDIEKKVVKAVGNAKERFEEDALRMMRAVRFYAELGFTVEGKTEEAIKESAKLLEFIAKERIRDEFVKIIMSDGNGAMNGVLKLEELGLLEYIIPELREGIDVGQNKHHIYTVWEHNFRALDYSASKGYSFDVRLASLLHDVGKPKVKQGDGIDSTFYAHEMVGAKMTAKILDRLHFSKQTIEKISHLVRSHLFYYNVGEVTEAGVRRFINRVGIENVDDLLKVREADRIGSGVPKAVPYKTRHLQFMLEKVMADPVSPKMIKVKGDDVIRILGIEPGPKVGAILSVLLEEILDNPKENEANKLESRIIELGKMSYEELENLSKKAKNRKQEFEVGVEEEMKKKYYVK